MQARRLEKAKAAEESNKQDEVSLMQSEIKEQIESMSKANEKKVP